MGKEKVLLGRKGEDETVNYLQKNNYHIITRNFKFKNGEIDIIAQDGDFLVFIEVKTRKNTQYGSPEYSITNKKKSAILRTANYYLYKNNLESISCRIDVITILYDNNNCFKLNHYKNV